MFNFQRVKFWSHNVLERGTQAWNSRVILHVEMRIKKYIPSYFWQQSFPYLYSAIFKHFFPGHFFSTMPKNDKCCSGESSLQVCCFGGGLNHKSGLQFSRRASLNITPQRTIYTDFNMQPVVCNFTFLLVTESIFYFIFWYCYFNFPFCITRWNLHPRALIAL